MDSASGGAIATSVLILESTASIFAAFCPSWFTVRSDFFNEQKSRAGNKTAIRQGEAAATVISVATGVAASVLTGSPLPTIGALVMSVVMVGGYEYSMIHPASEQGQAQEDAARPVAGWWRSA